MPRPVSYLGFPTKQEYLDFCRHLVKVYEENKTMTINSLCSYTKDEFDIDLSYNKARAILKDFDVHMRPQAGKKYKKQRIKMFRCKIEADDVDFITEIYKAYGRHARAELLDFIFAILRGRPTESMVLWLSDLKPVVFLYDKKYLKYRVFSEGLSKLESKILEELMVQVEDERSLKSVINYAKDKHLQYFGATA